MKNYPTYLTDRQYETILAIIGDTRKRKRSLKAFFDAIFYLVKTGCQWRMLPSDFPLAGTVYYYFSKWSRDGTLEEIHQALRSRLRKQRGRKISPSVGLIDSQSVKNTRVGGECRGWDGRKKIKRRKQHIITDNQGLLLAVKIHSAQEHDSKAGFEGIESIGHRFDRMQKRYADGGYRGDLSEKVKERFGWNMDITLRTDKSF